MLLNFTLIDFDLALKLYGLLKLIFYKFFYLYTFKSNYRTILLSD